MFFLGINFGFSSLVSAQLILSESLLTFFSSILNLGGLFGCLFVGPLLTTWGRCTSFRIASFVAIIGWLLISTAQILHPSLIPPIPRTFIVPLLVGRILSGLSVGMMTTVASVYLVEIAPPAQSGRYGSLAQCAVVAGTCTAYYSGMVTTWFLTARYMVIVSMVLFLASFYLPESPVWLARRDSNSLHEAVLLLTWLRGDVSTLKPSSTVLQLLHDLFPCLLF